LLTHGFFYIYTFSFNLVAGGIAFEYCFINGIVIIEFDKPESTRFSSIFFRQTGDGYNFAKFFKILSNIFFGVVFFEAANKNLFNSLSSLWFSKFFPWSCSFCFNRFSIDGVGPCSLAGIDFLVVAESHKTKSSRPFCIWEFHDYYIDKLSILREMALE